MFSLANLSTFMVQLLHRSNRIDKRASVGDPKGKTRVPQGALHDY